MIKDSGIAEVIFHKEHIKKEEEREIASKFSNWEDHNFKLRVQKSPSGGEKISIVVSEENVNQAFDLEEVKSYLSNDQENLIRKLADIEDRE